MPSGGGLSFDHSKLTEIIGEFVARRKIGEVFLTDDITDYISKLPIKRFARKTKQGIPNQSITFEGSITRKGQFEKSQPYFSGILRTNAIKWNIRYGSYFGHHGIREIKNGEGEIISHLKTHSAVFYCKTDNLGSFFCVSCGVDITLKPQWAYLRNSEKRSSRPKTIRRDIHCNRCYDRYEIMRFDHTVDVGGGRKTIGGALSWRIKDRFRHWAGEEE